MRDMGIRGCAVADAVGSTQTQNETPPQRRTQKQTKKQQPRLRH